MSLYFTIEYLDGFYGGESTDAPQNLKFYRTNSDNRYVFYWTFDPTFINSNLVPSILSILDVNNNTITDLNGNIVLANGNITPYDWELQIDSNPAFPAPSVYTSSNVLNFQNGVLAKGYEVSVQPRTDKEEVTLYARVRTLFSTNTSSAFSNILQFNTIKKYSLDFNEKLLDVLPDENVYNKDILNMPVVQRNSIVYSLLYGSYSNEFDNFELQSALLKTDIALELCRDEQLYDNFGYLFDYPISDFNHSIPTDLQPIEYRIILKSLMTAALNGSTLYAINSLASAFTGINSTINLVRNLGEGFEGDFFLEDIPGTSDDNLTMYTRSNGELANGIQITLNNPTSRQLDIPTIQNLILKIVAAHTRITFTS